jgi:hypothetical protein
VRTVTTTELIGFFDEDCGGGLRLDEVAPRAGRLGLHQSSTVDWTTVLGGERMLRREPERAYARIKIMVEWEPLSEEGT